MVLNMQNRVLRSSASSASAPAGRTKDNSTRKEYVHNSAPSAFNPSQRKSSAVLERFRKVMTWSNTRKVPLVNCMIIVIFMVVTLLTSLLLRTQMAEISFDQTAVQMRISRLHQDVEARQAKLDTLESELPARAQRMGMVPQQGSISIDLSDYAAKRKHGHSEKTKHEKQTNNSNKTQKQEQQNRQYQQKAKQEKH
ncbi:hypothetical protein HXT50_03125 [Gardnerella sp. KA00243]|jgi:hypothetical protein|uniref:Uncharacterized protein n=2 Tax=Gardnerella TaxID=2701 RepID=A0AAP8IUC1_GARVA|nr:MULTISPECIES: hypothetical protein [Gardnerella]EFH26960.1 hypothetical protein GVAMD_0507 [Gardnerella vaginalis AMD]EIK77426.1 hypothetical protein CGSMWGv6420LIT_04538 [Gardnerella vaginalis 6420LIT]EIK78470.1 hypothetical protein CGSMWGv6420B_04785 [Gardnerella vaginalis 6420B]NSX30846.1 hypothetical protein [Gardnerella vaginalis]RFT34346.1 hypothetical protein CG401_00550 [Bifidobacteriaceae bacterium NR019]RIY27740.1 hypothetical protein CJI52_02885 [Bifidobacteriaceae bacterium WP0